MSSHTRRVLLAVAGLLLAPVAGLPAQDAGASAEPTASASAYPDWGTILSYSGDWYRYDTVGWVWDDWEPGGWVWFTDMGWMWTILTWYDGWWLWSPEGGWYWSDHYYFPWLWSYDGVWVNTDWDELVAPSLYQLVTDARFLYGRGYQSAFSSSWGTYYIGFYGNGTFDLLDGDVWYQGWIADDGWYVHTSIGPYRFDPGYYNPHADRLYFRGVKLLRI